MFLATAHGAAGDDADNAFAQARDAYRKGNFDAAVRHCTDAIRLKPDFAKAYYARGSAYAEKGDIDRAIADYGEAIRLKPGYAEAYFARGLAQKKKGDYGKAISDYTDAIRLKPAAADAYYSRGMAYEKKGEHAKAIADYTEAIQLKPTFADAYHARGNANDENGDHDKAIADYGEAVRLKPDDAMTYYDRGIAFRRKGDPDKAIADFSETIRLKPDFAPAYRGRGVARLSKGDEAGARADFAQARQRAGKLKAPVLVAISAPIVYDGLMLVLSDEDGVAAIIFPTEIERGVKYKYRYLPIHGKEERGEGEVFEKYRNLPGSKPGETQVVNDGGKLSIKAGALKVVWSAAQAGRGYIYYHPELIRVQIANASDFEKLDLGRFAAVGITRGGRFWASPPDGESASRP